MNVLPGVFLRSSVFYISIFPLRLLAQQLFLWKRVIPDFPAVPVWKGHRGPKPYTHPGFEKIFCYFLQEVEHLMPGCQPSAYSDKGLLRKVSCSSSTQVPPVCWSCLAPHPARHHSWQLPCPTLPWFYKWHLKKCPVLIFMFNSSSSDEQGSSRELSLASPVLLFLIHSMSGTSTQGRDWEKEVVPTQILLCLLYSLTFYVSAWPSTWAARCNLNELLSFIHELPFSCSLEEHSFKRLWWVC